MARRTVRSGGGLERGARPESRTAGPAASRVAQAVDRIRQLIAERKLVPGMRLPAERQLASEFCVGRPAVREAIRALTMLGTVESRDRDGTYLKSLSAVERRPLAALESHYDLLQLLEVRRMLEPRAAALAAIRAGGKEIREIEAELAVQEADPADHRILQKHDFLFHDAILRAAGNQILSDIARVLGRALRRSRQITAHTTPNVAAIVRQHRRIFDAIRLGQPDLAERAMADHLETVGLDLISERTR